MEYRVATEKDIPAICQIRKQQLIDEGSKPDIDIDEELQCYFEKKFEEGSIVEWLLEDEGKIIATAAVLFFEFPPNYSYRNVVKGYITNMYTAPEYRGRGIASAMLSKLADEAKKRGVHQIWLIASKLGRPVYKRFGFTKSDDYLTMSL